MNRFLTVFLISFISTTSIFSQSQSEIKERIISAIKSTNTIECNFSQTKHLKILKQELSAKGKLFFTDTDCIRWQYTSPQSYSIVINRNKMLVESDKNKTITDINKNRIAREIAKIMKQALQGNFLQKEDEFEVSIVNNNSSMEITLKPKKQEIKRMFSLIKLYVSHSTYMINRVEISERSGDLTTISFSNIKRNTTIDTKVFKID